MIRNIYWSYSPILIKVEVSLQIFEKYSNIKFHENRFNGSRVVPCGRSDKTGWHDKANSRFSQILWKRLKMLYSHTGHRIWRMRFACWITKATHTNTLTIRKTYCFYTVTFVTRTSLLACLVITKEQHVYCTVRTEYLNTYQVRLSP
jgi:hypothetical protein